MNRRTTAVLFVLTLAAVRPAFAQADAGVEADAGVPPSAEDEKLLKEIEAAQAASPKGAPAAPANATGSPETPAPSAEKGKASSFFSNIYNPAMSVNGLFLGSFSSEKRPPPTEAQSGIAIQEIEVQVLANVDPYLSANVVLSMPGGTNIGVEEGWLALTPQPLGIGLRAGQLKVPFGRENMTHTHALPFVDRSLIGTAVFGDGLDEVGVEGTWLAPLPWYLLVTGEVLNGDNPIFNSPNGRDLAYFGALKNVFDLDDDTTAELGASYVAGKNAASQVSQVAGAHLVFKWKPARASTTKSAVLTLEGMFSRAPTAAVSDSGADTWGFYSYAQWQLAQRWYAGGRYEYLRPAGGLPQGMRESAILVFAPSEFSAFRLQFNLHQPGGSVDQVFEAFIQANFTLGAHPAHSY